MPYTAASGRPDSRAAWRRASSVISPSRSIASLSEWMFGRPCSNGTGSAPGPVQRIGHAHYAGLGRQRVPRRRWPITACSDSEVTTVRSGSS